MKKIAVAFVFALLVPFGYTIYEAVAQTKGPTVIGADKEPSVSKAPPAASSLVSVNLNEAMLAKREAAMDAMEKNLQAQLEELVAEHERRVQEMKDWREKERAKIK